MTRWIQLFVLSVGAACVVRAQHPYIWLDATELAQLRAQASENTADWQALKNACDTIYLPATTYYPYDLDVRPDYNGPAYNRIYSRAAITVGYQGGAASNAKSLGYYDALLNLGSCYQALKSSAPATAATYAAKGAEILRKMSRAPGIITLSGGAARIIGDSTWDAGTGWKPSGITVAASNTLYGSTIGLQGLKPSGTILQNDNFVLGNKIYTVKTSTVANSSGIATVTVAISSSAQYMPAIQSDGPFSSVYSVGSAVTTPIVVYSLGNGIASGTPVTISGVAGNTAVNGVWTADTTISADRLLLRGSNAVGTTAPQSNLAWQPLVNQGYGARFYGVALARGLDWFYDAMTAGQRAVVISEVERWYAEVKRYSYGTYGMKHPAGNYFAGEWFFLTCAGAALNDDDPTTSATIWSEAYNTYYAGSGSSGGGPTGAWVQQYFANYVRDAFHPDGVNYGWFAMENILSTVLTMNTYKGLNLFSSPAPAFTWPNGLAKTLIHHTWPNRTTTSSEVPWYDSRGVSFTSNSGVSGQAVIGPPVLMLNYILSRYGFAVAPYFQSFVAELVPQFDAVSISYAPYPWTDLREYAYKVLFYDSSASSVDYKTLPLSQYSDGWSEMAMRSDWSTSAVWANFNAGPWIESTEASKLVGDSGNIAITRGSTRFLVNGPAELAWNNNDGSTYYLSPSSTNDPAPHNIFWADGATAHRKKQQGYGSGYVYPEYYPCLFANGSSITRKAENAAFVYSRATGLEANYPPVGYAGVDSCNGATRTVTHWTRDVLFLRPKLFLIRDFTTIPDGSRAQGLMWHFGKAPVSATPPAGFVSRYDVSDSTAGVYKGSVFTVAPTAHVVNVVNGVLGGYGTPATNQVYRLEMNAALGAASNVWLTMFDAASSNGSVYTYSKLAANNADAVQVAEIGVVAVFPTSETGPTSISYSFSAGGSVTHYVSGLTPSTAYSLTADGSAKPLSSDSSGMLTFSTNGPSPTVSVVASEGIAPLITTASLADGVVGVSYSRMLAATGSMPITGPSPAARFLPGPP